MYIGGWKDHSCQMCRQSLKNKLYTRKGKKKFGFGWTQKKILPIIMIMLQIMMIRWKCIYKKDNMSEGYNIQCQLTKKKKNEKKRKGFWYLFMVDNDTYTKPFSYRKQFYVYVLLCYEDPVKYLFCILFFTVISKRWGYTALSPCSIHSFV